MSKRDLLAEVPLFQGSSNKELAQISAIANRVVAEPGEILVGEGEAGDLFFVIERGEAEVTIGGQRVAQLSAGGFFGEVALLDALPRTATVTARTQMTLYTVKGTDFSRFLDNSPSVTRKILTTVSERLRSVEHAPSYAAPEV
ncbi:MAG: cyclic nucleotide-binding domain-containing protein [Actinomycetota bacterium]|nr:cyclic nucleotide-binding domain-containing protein [Actinomycetota bacterium]